MTQEAHNWKTESNIASKIEYKKKFALFPTTCSDNTRVWLKPYYTMYKIYGWSNDGKIFNGDNYLHRDKIEDIAEDTYLIRKLIEGF